MFVVHGTRKLLARVGGPTASPDATSATALGSWYATALFWKPQVVLFVNESTLLPVLMPLAPATTVVDRVPAALSIVLATHGVSDRFIEREVAEMADHQVAPTRNRSVVGSMNEFAFLGEMFPQPGWGDDLVALSLRLSEVPCAPLSRRHGSPDRELAALVADRSVG